MIHLVIVGGVLDRTAIKYNKDTLDLLLFFSVICAAISMCVS